MPVIIDLKGQRFGSLFVLKLANRANWISPRNSYWLCVCDCDEFTIVNSNQLRNGRTKSCGCLRGPITHGFTREIVHPWHGRHPLYGVWRGMKERCTNPNHRGWKYYGGRGITVCERWQRFEDFYEDVKRLYVSWLTMDRINNDKGYEPGNVRWVEKTVQSANRRNSK